MKPSGVFLLGGAFLTALVFVHEAHAAKGAATLPVTEIMYNPPTNGVEFLELKNTGTATLDLSGAYFTDGIDFTFPAGTTVDPGEFVVLTTSEALFNGIYPGVPVAGAYLAVLANSGETLTLNAANNSVLMSVTYDDRPPWPAGADGAGFSIAVIDPAADPNDPNNWRHSSAVGGTPGADEVAAALPIIVINEALTHSDAPQADVVEFYNPNPTPVDIRGWLLTDDIRFAPKALIPSLPQYLIAPGEYALIDEDTFAISPGFLNGMPLPGFRLSAFGGEGIYIFSANSTGTLTGSVHGFKFDASENGVSFGRIVTSDGKEHFVPQAQNSFGSANLGPQSGNVVVTEIYYAPFPGDVEYMELTNATGIELRLWDTSFGGDPNNTYEINGIGFAFPINASMPAGATLLVVNDDPNMFRARLSVPPDVGVFGPFGNNSIDGIASLSDSGESITIRLPDTPDAGVVPLLTVDKTTYDDVAPWPDVLNNGSALRRLDLAQFGGEPQNWEAVPATYGTPLGGNPAIVSVSPQSLDFGIVIEGMVADMLVTVTNIGGETLSGTASIGDPFQIASGGIYDLAPGASQDVTITFAPTAPGEFIREAFFSGGGGATIPVEGQGLTGSAQLVVTPSALDFGAIMVGEESLMTIGIINTGGGMLQGTATAGAPFSLSGTNAYTIPGLSSLQLMVAFSPASDGAFMGEVTLTGGGGATVTLQGEATAVVDPPTGCSASNGTSPRQNIGDILILVLGALILIRQRRSA